MPHTKRSITVLAWLVSLINPPPLQAMTQMQKVFRVFVFTMATVTICVLSSMFAAAGIFLFQHATRMFSDFPELIGDLGIIFVSMLVNALCVMVLLKIKNADQKLIPPQEPPRTSKPE
jgi:hypothetical protein